MKNNSRGSGKDKERQVLPGFFLSWPFASTYLDPLYICEKHNTRRRLRRLFAETSPNHVERAQTVNALIVATDPAALPVILQHSFRSKAFRLRQRHRLSPRSPIGASVCRGVKYRRHPCGRLWELGRATRRRLNSRVDQACWDFEKT